MSDVLKTEDDSDKKAKSRATPANDLQTELWAVTDDVPETPVEEKRETVGDILRKVRLEKRLDLRDVAADLCIRPRFLEDLENGNTKELPGDAYAQGFVRSYASYLGLDAVGLAAQYKLETSDNLNETLKVVSPDSVGEAEKSAPAPKFVFFSLALLLVGYVVWQGFFSSAEEELPPVAESVTILEESYPLPEDEPQPPAPPSAEQPAPQPEPQPVPPVPPKKPEVPALEPKTYGQQSPASRLYLVAKEPTWIEITRGEVLMISRTLNKGDRYFVSRNAENMLLRTGNAGGLEFYLDGKKMPPIGPRGALRANISLDPDKFPAVEKKAESAEQPAENGESAEKAEEVSENEEPAEEKAEEE